MATRAGRVTEAIGISIDEAAAFIRKEVADYNDVICRITINKHCDTVNVSTCSTTTDQVDEGQIVPAIPATIDELATAIAGRYILPDRRVGRYDDPLTGNCYRNLPQALYAIVTHECPGGANSVDHRPDGLYVVTVWGAEDDNWKITEVLVG